MTSKLRKILEKAKSSNDINTWVLSLLTLTKQEVELLVDNANLPISASIIANFLLSKDVKEASKIKFLSDYIKHNIEEVILDKNDTLKLEFTNSKMIQKLINNEIKDKADVS